MTRREELIYAVDELPPWPRLIFLGAACGTDVGISRADRHRLPGRRGQPRRDIGPLSLGMVAPAISTVLQGIWDGPVGSGYLAPRYFRRSTLVLLCLWPAPAGFRMKARSEGQNVALRLIFSG
jgi:hypothetical protein